MILRSAGLSAYVYKISLPTPGLYLRQVRLRPPRPPTDDKQQQRLEGLRDWDNDVSEGNKLPNRR
jgi:hypothetical protein